MRVLIERFTGLVFLVLVIRLNRNPPAHLVGHSMQSRPRVWKRLHRFGNAGVSGADISMMMGSVLFIPGLG